MTNIQLTKFINYLKGQSYAIIGPKLEAGRLLFREIEAPQEMVLNGKLTFYPPKKYFLPEKEVLFEYKKNHLLESSVKSQKQAVFGLTPLDLKGVLLYYQVFEKDVGFQKRLENTIVIGQSLMPCDSKSFCFWEDDYEEDVLEHLRFDIYFGLENLRESGRKFQKSQIARKIKVFTGSGAGQRILSEFGYRNYEHVDYAGPIQEQGPNKRMLRIKQALKKNNPKIWQELGQVCLACGKCALVCPMCFCFDIQDKPGLKSGEGQRIREWAACFYDEFSQVGGGHRFLDTTAKRIHFWYEHKFVRMPEEFGFMGCTGCGRCTQVCPVGINIQKNLKDIVNLR